MNSLTENIVGVLDRGFSSKEFFKKTPASNKFFVIIISKLYKLEFVESSDLIKVGTGKNSGLYRVVNSRVPLRAQLARGRSSIFVI